MGFFLNLTTFTEFRESDTEAWIGVNLKISFVTRANILFSYTGGGRFE